MGLKGSIESGSVCSMKAVEKLADGIYLKEDGGAVVVCNHAGLFFWADGRVSTFTNVANFQIRLAPVGTRVVFVQTEFTEEADGR